ncbi:MAG TPA: hypothetical protein VGL53_06830 [Bryobacteraceae bacterium]
MARWKPLKIGVDYLEKSTQDDQLALHLRGARRITFFSLDRDFFIKRWTYGHANCSIVFVDAAPKRFAAIVDRFLRHPSFRTHADRMGSVFKLNEDFIVCWNVSSRTDAEIPWPR